MAVTRTKTKLKERQGLLGNANFIVLPRTTLDTSFAGFSLFIAFRLMRHAATGF